MNLAKAEDLLSVVMSGELPISPSSQQLFSNQDPQDEEASDCPLLTPSPANQTPDGTEHTSIFNNNPHLEAGTPLEMSTAVIPKLDNINSEDRLKAFMNNLVNSSSSSKIINDEPSSRDPMVESSSSEESSVTNEPVCTQLLTQLNTAYQHLAPDAQAIFYNQDNGGKPPLVPIQLMVPKPPKDYSFVRWNWPRIRKISFWFMVWILGLCTALAIHGIAMMPRRCDPEMKWWQGSLFYEIFPASFQDSSKAGHGIGDLHGVTMRLDYLKGLGVEAVRLNSIFKSDNYPENYARTSSLTLIDENIGDLEDFKVLVEALHTRNMSLVLDLPLYPFVKSLSGGISRRSSIVLPAAAPLNAAGSPALPVGAIHPASHNENNADKENASLLFRRDKRKASAHHLLSEDDIIRRTTAGSMSHHDHHHHEDYSNPDNNNNEKEEHVVTGAIRYWSKKGVDGFYLKGLKHYLKDRHFVELLYDWSAIVSRSHRILIGELESIEAAKGPARQALLDVLHLVDVNLRVSNGTKDIKSQIDRVIDDDGSGIMFAHRPEERHHQQQPWVQWSIGGVDTRPRIASALKIHNASTAITLLGLMLPGTPNIFYGDEIGMKDCECEDHQDLKHLHNLSPMYWEAVPGSSNNFSGNGVVPWLPISSKPAISDMDTGAIRQMMELRRNTASIFVESAVKHDRVTPNCAIRYCEDELIVIERWYPRQHTYVYVANLGTTRQVKDLSSLYYDGHVVVGPPALINENIYFKHLAVSPGEAYIIKLDK